MHVKVLPVTPFQQNCSVLHCAATDRVAVVDPGGDRERIVDAIMQTGGTLEKIFLTHGHLDHAGAAAGLSRQFGVPVEGPHVDDQFLLQSLPRQGARYGFVECDALTPDRWLNEADEIRFGDQSFNVWHCPGHTPGHVIFFHRPQRIAFVGDVLFNGSVGRTDLPRGDHEQLVRSIRQKLWPLGDDVAFYPGHGETSTFGWERKCNPYVADLMFD
ncbi:MAG: MBL fold metallo-hydrolase [Pseudomonadota bacterium]